MEAVPRLPMINFELKYCNENVSFQQPLKQYISQFYGEDSETYTNEIHNLESLRGAATRATTDIEGVQLLKKYYCQLHFLKSRFPMEEQQAVSVSFSWKDPYSGLSCNIPDIRFELMCILYNIGALHTQLGAMEQRTTPDGMKISCTHFQCAAWAFQMLREQFHSMVTYISNVEVMYFMELVSLAQAQECILEKSMMDNRKATIIVKVAVQVVEYYRRAQVTIQGGSESDYTESIRSSTFKEWMKYLNFKIAYHKCISLLFQGQQAEEQQKMGERVALFQAAAEQLETARKLANNMNNKQEIMESIAFTSDVVEGKKKAAKNENDFIYHEEIPIKDTFQEIKGASLVKGIPFNINDVEVSGPDIFARLIPMEAHEAASLYSEKKAELLRNYGVLVEGKEKILSEFIASMQIDFLNELRQATGLPQDIVDRAAALSAKQHIIPALKGSMTKLSNTYHEVDSTLNEIQELLDEEDKSEKEYQKSIGERPPSIILTDLSREFAKYREAHTRAEDSNQTLHKAMTTHLTNLKLLSTQLTELQQNIPSVQLPNENVDDATLKEIELLIVKIDEMKTQRKTLWAQLREAVHKDDITGVLVTKQPNQTIDDVFEQELKKHHHLTALIEQNLEAQDNILKIFIEKHAKFSTSRRYLQNIISRRKTIISNLITSYDNHEDLLMKANKGIEFYTKLETNVTKLLQRIKSSCKVQQEEREQMLSKNIPKKQDIVSPATQLHNISAGLPTTNTESNAPKLKDYLDSMKSSSRNTSNYPTSNYMGNEWPIGVRPNPVGSEINDLPNVKYDSSAYTQSDTNYMKNTNYNLQPQQTEIDYSLESRLKSLSVKENTLPYQQQYGYNTYAPYYNSLSNENTNQHTQYIPNHYQMNFGADKNSSYEQQNTSNHIYASGYATAQNYQTSNMATVQSGNLKNYYESYQNPQSYPNMPQQNETIQNVTQPIEIPKNTVEQAKQVEMIQNYQNYPMVTQPSEMNYQNYSQVGPQQQTQMEQYQNYYQQYYQSQYSEGYGGVASLIGQNQMNPSYMYTQAGTNNYTYNTNNTSSSTGGLTSPQSIQNPVEQTGNYSYISNTKLNETVSTSPVKKVSTMDLLAGLEFTINQAPLEPEQKQIEMIKKDEQVITPPTTTITSTTKDIPVKIEQEIKQLKIITSKSLNNEDVKKLFKTEIDKYEKFVDVLSNKTLSGPTNLDLKWKEIQDNDTGKGTISVARCYPMKNRFPDILPYDHSRVLIESTNDDYINASYVKDVSQFVPPIIITQLPLQSTIVEFWTMILEQHVEFVMCLLSDSEMNGDVYWPSERGKDINTSDMVISIQSMTVKTYWKERIINISKPNKREFSTIIHLQFTDWPGSLFPSSPDPFVGFIKEFITLYQQQRLHSNPLVIHCLSGIGRSGVASLLIYAILEATNLSNIPDLIYLTNKISLFRKNILRDREHLKFSYQTFLSYMKQIINDGILLKTVDSTTIKEDNLNITNNKMDPLSSLDPFWASRKDKK